MITTIYMNTDIEKLRSKFDHHFTFLRWLSWHLRIKGIRK